mgnify:CR=1 FL=1
MRRVFIFILVTAVTAMVIFMTINYDGALPNELRTYYAENALADTGALNVVTAIYLNYRLYDTLFEALTLLISVLAIIYFSRHAGHDYEI